MSLNTQGGPGVWRCFNSFFTSNKARAFGRCAARKRFNFYFGPGPPAKGCHTTVWTSGWLIGSVYAPPREVSPHAATTLLTEALVASEN